jgi:hypothetical protein
LGGILTDWRFHHSSLFCPAVPQIFRQVRHHPHDRRMRTLFVIPHAFFRTTPGAPRYQSERGDAEARAAILLRCLSTLHQTFGPRQHLVGSDSAPRCNEATDAAIEIVLCTSGQDHLAHTLPPHLFHHHTTTLHPRLLGFACHAILRDNAGRFDWFAYLEDDCEVSDPLFFTKLAWFGRQFGDQALLQPNRFEVSAGEVVQKLYIDGNRPLPAAGRAVQDITVRPRLTGSAFGRSWVFQRVDNPHSGCFFVNAAQMARLAADPAFGHYSDEFVGPLESAATLPVLRNFDLYKPARENAAFLEIRHLDQRFLDRKITYHLNDRQQVIKTVLPDEQGP